MFEGSSRREIIAGVVRVLFVTELDYAHLLSNLLKVVSQRDPLTKQGRLSPDQEEVFKFGSIYQVTGRSLPLFAVNSA